MSVAAASPPEIKQNLVGAFLEWVIEHDRVVYGSTAINAVLPQELKMFADLTVPDFDILTPDAPSDTDDLVRMFRTLGHTTSVAIDAHTNVRRVFVDGVVLTRVTQIPKVVYARLHEDALHGDNGMLVAPVDYLRMALFYELSRNDVASSWSAMFDRLLRIDRAFGINLNAPPCEPEVSEERDQDARALIQDARAFIAKSKLVMCGYAAVAMVLADGVSLDAPARLDPSSTCMDVFSNDPVETTAQFTQVFAGRVAPSRITVKNYRAGVVFPRHSIVRLDGRPLIGIFHADRCIAFVKIDGVRVATLDTLLAMYLRTYVMGRPTANLMCLCKLLAHQQYRRYDSDKPIFKRFVTECYGSKN